MFIQLHGSLAGKFGINAKYLPNGVDKDLFADPEREINTMLYDSLHSTCLGDN